MTNIEALQHKLSDGECALLFDETNRRYLTKMKSSDGTVAVFPDSAYLIIDFRYYEKAKKLVRDCEVIKQERLYRQINTLIKKHNAARVLIDEERATVADYFSLKENLKAKVVLKGGLSKILCEQRSIKTEAEKEKIISAQRIAEHAFSELLNSLKVGISEREAALELNRLMFLYGAEDLSFETIALGGANTSVPHGTPGEYRLKDGDFFLFDFGAVYDGYHSDMTRTVAIGDVDDKKRLVYDTVLAAQTAGIERIRNGVKASDVDEAARTLIDNAGFKGCFGHSFGHGVGLEIHETPNVSPRCETKLTSGMVVTAEPGIYLEGEFGVRIEDFGAVTEDGFINFTQQPKAFLAL